MKLIEKLKIKYNQSLLSKNLKLKQKIKGLELDKTNLIKEKQELYNLIDVQQSQYRELDIKLRNIRNMLKNNELFNVLEEIIKWKCMHCIMEIQF